MIVDLDDWEGLNVTHDDFRYLSFAEWCELVDEYNELLAQVNRLRKRLDEANERARLAIESHPNADEMLKELIE